MAGTENLFSSEVPALLQRHLDALCLGSGLSLEIIRERGYRSILGKKELASVAGRVRVEQNQNFVQYGSRSE